MDYEIETMRANDVPELAKLCVQFADEISPNRTTRLFLADYGALLTKLAKSKSSVVCVAKQIDRSVVGFMLLEFRAAVSSGGQFVSICDIYVSPEHRRRGICNLFLNTAKQHTAKFGLKRIELYTGVSDIQKMPNSIYVRHGFQHVGPHFRWKSS